MFSTSRGWKHVPTSSWCQWWEISWRHRNPFLGCSRVYQLYPSKFLHNRDLPSCYRMKRLIRLCAQIDPSWSGKPILTSTQQCLQLLRTRLHRKEPRRPPRNSYLLLVAWCLIGGLEVDQRVKGGRWVCEWTIDKGSTARVGLDGRMIVITNDMRLNEWKCTVCGKWAWRVLPQNWLLRCSRGGEELGGELWFGTAEDPRSALLRLSIAH